MELTIAILFTYGVTKIITAYDGPFKIIAKLRNKHDLCFGCLAFWVGIFPAIFLASNFNVFFWLAAVGGAIAFDNLCY